MNCFQAFKSFSLESFGTYINDRYRPKGSLILPIWFIHGLHDYSNDFVMAGDVAGNLNVVAKALRALSLVDLKAVAAKMNNKITTLAIPEAKAKLMRYYFYFYFFIGFCKKKKKNHEKIAFFFLLGPCSTMLLLWLVPIPPSCWSRKISWTPPSMFFFLNTFFFLILQTFKWILFIVLMYRKVLKRNP